MGTENHSAGSRRAAAASKGAAGTLGRYRIVTELGRGAMGRVFLAHDPQIDRRVAIKTILIFSSLPDAERRQARERFLREARAAGRLLHPGIVTIFDVGETDGVPYLAMEYVEGTTLDAFCLGENLLPVKTSVEIVAKVAEALHFAHRTGIVHRDIKPANLMRVGDLSVKIMDFGLARGAEAQVTQDGALIGTPSYMSPEQIRGHKLDGRSDLFSLAAVLYEMLTGEKPFPGETVSSIIYRVVHEQPRSASETHERVPPGLARFLDRALAKDPDGRFESGEAFAKSLREAGAGDASAAGEPGKAGPTERTRPEDLPPPPRRHRRRRRFPLMLLLALLAAAGAVAGYRFREEIREFLAPQPKEVWFETRVRTDPPGLPITIDGATLEGSTVRFRQEGPFGLLATTQACRTVEHQLAAADAGTEVVLVPDPVDVEVTIDPGVHAGVLLNGESLGRTPVRATLDLCRDNRIDLSADGYRDASLDLPTGATPLEVRTALGALEMSPIPKGRLIVAKSRVKLRYYVDGERVDDLEGGIELAEGRHTLRAVNTDLWIDVTRTVDVQGGEAVTPTIDIPGLAQLVVQAFPANCKVYLRRPGGGWKYVDDVPLRRRIAAGSYEVKVVLNPTGEERTRGLKLAPGQNPPVRFAFARGS